jgi:hypothetical protein
MIPNHLTLRKKTGSPRSAVAAEKNANRWPGGRASWLAVRSHAQMSGCLPFCWMPPSLPRMVRGSGSPGVFFRHGGAWPRRAMFPENAVETPLHADKPHGGERATDAVFWL